MERALLLATSNSGKIAEYSDLLAAVNFQFVLPKQLGLESFEVAETGQSFSENALIKAKAYGDKTNIITLAEDSGLEVTALNQDPGVRSARYVQGSDQDRYEKILVELGDNPNRQAQFITVICLYKPETSQHQLFTGRLVGSIARQPAGSSGFGYDPIFIPNGHDQTLGELGTNIKNQISHRRQALDQLLAFLETADAHGSVFFRWFVLNY